VDPLALTRRALLGFFSTALALLALACRVQVADVFATLRRAFLGVLLAGAGLGLLASPARTEELGAAGHPTTSAISVHDADETLRDWCQRDDSGTLRLVLPGGASFELVTSVDDSAISNHGDGAFHPFEVAEVRAALATVRYPLDGVAADVFILPYPCRSVLASAAGPGLILLSPGVYALPRSQQHAEFVHELGHVVQYSRLPDGDISAWDQYRALRGISDTRVYQAGAPHAERPHEIFAEDFRALFGDELAAGAGTIENATIAPPAAVPGLAEFLLDLSGIATTVTLRAGPNPARGVVSFARAGARLAALDVFDLAGRRLATLAPQASADGVRWSWDGRDAAGRPSGPGIVFARARDGGAVVRVTLLP
jgi:hypothetical protein